MHSQVSASVTAYSRRVLVAVLIVCALSSWHTAHLVEGIDRAMLRTYFQCPPCESAQCPTLPPGGCEVMIKEPGMCACCMTCARLEGEGCGVFTERCAPGLSCQPLRVSQHHPEAGWESLFSGKGMCVSDSERENMVGDVDNAYRKW